MFFLRKDDCAYVVSLFLLCSETEKGYNPRSTIITKLFGTCSTDGAPKGVFQLQYHFKEESFVNC